MSSKQGPIKPKYTLGFIRCTSKVLFLNRQKAPWMGRWNGVGGKINENESPYDCIVRETHEETGLLLPQYQPRGLIRWSRDGIDLGGVYVFSADVSEDVMNGYQTPKAFCHEGILDWKSLNWVLDPENTGVVDNVQIILKALFTASAKSLWNAVYQKSVLVSCNYSEER